MAKRINENPVETEEDALTKWAVNSLHGKNADYAVLECLWNELHQEMKRVGRQHELISKSERLEILTEQVNALSRVLDVLR